MRFGDVGQHLLCHELRHAVRIDGAFRRILSDGHMVWNAIGRCRRRKDDVLHAIGHRCFDEGARIGGVIRIIFQRIFYRFRNHNGSGKMKDCPDIIVFDRAGDGCKIPDIRHDERNICRNGPAESGRQIVDDDCFDAMITKRKHGVASDVTSATRYENRQAIQRCCHERLSFNRLRPNSGPETGYNRPAAISVPRPSRLR